MTTQDEIRDAYIEYCKTQMEFPDRADVFEAGYNAASESIRQQLAESQATNFRLQNDLRYIHNELAVLPRNNFEPPTKAFDRSIKALALPNDATALNELIAERTKELTAEVERLKREDFSHTLK